MIDPEPDPAADGGLFPPPSPPLDLAEERRRLLRPRVVVPPVSDSCAGGSSTSSWVIVLLRYPGVGRQNRGPRDIWGRPSTRFTWGEGYCCANNRQQINATIHGNFSDFGHRTLAFARAPPSRPLRCEIPITPSAGLPTFAHRDETSLNRHLALRARAVAGATPTRRMEVVLTTTRDIQPRQERLANRRSDQVDVPIRHWLRRQARGPLHLRLPP